MIPPIPPLIKDKLSVFFFNSIRDKLNRSVKIDVYTTTQRDSITDWKKGEMIFNETLNTAQIYGNSGWVSL